MQHCGFALERFTQPSNAACPGKPSVTVRSLVSASARLGEPGSIDAYHAPRKPMTHDLKWELWLYESNLSESSEVHCRP